MRGWGAARLFVASFAALIALGTLGLLVLPGLYTGPRLGLVDALFTAASAVCVTGLVVVDTATWFTPAGQAWILLLIQAGGLGILTFTTFLLALVGGRHLEMEEAVGGHAAVLRTPSFRTLLATILGVTFAVEGLGALALWLSWSGAMGPGPAAWHAIFHAVSAFCNAGFSTFSDSLVGLRTSIPTLGTIMGLVVVGGLGFVVLEDLRGRFLQRRTRRLGLHARLVLVSTGVLLAAGFGLFLLFEWNGALAGLGWADRVANALFLSVTPRTAGFNTVDYDTVGNPSLVLTMILMAVGGSPGSTAGGLKTVPVVLLVLLLWSRLRGRGHVAAFDRTVPQETVQRAAGLVVGGLAILALAGFLVLATEALTHPAQGRDGLVRLVFETTSAFGTVGLSMGVTDDLSVPGRLVVTGLMFLGRVGPAAVLASMVTARSRMRNEVRYAHEDVALG